METFRRLNHQERKISSLKNTILNTPERAGLYHDMAVIYGQRGEFEKARRRYIQAVTRDSNFAPSYHNLGNIQLRNRRLREAMGLFRRALRADSTYVPAYLSLGNMHMRRREFEAALQTYDRGLRLDPDNANLSERAAIAREAMASSSSGK